APQAEGADGVAERRQRTPERRAVETGRRAPVAVQLDDDVCPCPSEPYECRLVRALRDDRDRPVLAREPPHTQRQQQVEQRPVEQRQPPDEAEGPVVARATVGRRGEDAQVEPLAQRLE